MKKIVLFAIVCATLLFGGCKHETFTIDYSIGCMGYQSGSIQGTELEWNELVDYFETHVDYNKNVTFEGKSIAEADAKARDYYNEQLKKIDATYVCSLLHGNDHFDYGIKTLNANESDRYIKVMRFEENGAHEMDLN